MQVKDIIEILEGLAPASYACSWDNVGLQAGRRQAEVHKIYIGLDATDEVVEDAVRKGCDFLLTHHPLIFSPIKKVNEDTLEGRRLLRMIESGMAYYAMHTSYDAAPGAMADLAAERLGIKNGVPMEVTEEPAGIGRIGELEEPVTVREFCDRVKKEFHLPQVMLYGGHPDKMVYRAAVLPGSGGSEALLAESLGADAYVTGDLTHHKAIDAAAWGLTVIDAGHYGIEWIFIPHMAEYLKERLPKDIEIFTAPIELPGQVM